MPSLKDFGKNISVSSSGAQTIKLGKEEYDVVPPQAVAGSNVILGMYNKLGRPKDIFSPQGQKLVKIMISIWEDSYPLESKMWFEERKEYQSSELSVGEQVSKSTGRSLASFPYPLYQMIRAVFPEFDTGNRDQIIKFIKLFPMFRFANKI